MLYRLKDLKFKENYMKVTQVNDATEQDLAYMRGDLVDLINEIYEYQGQSKTQLEQDIQTTKDAVNLDFDSLKKAKFKEHDKKFRPAKIISTAVGLAGSIGMIAAGVITRNPTFFSAGNLIAAGLLPGIAYGVTDYISNFTFVHDQHDKIEQERKNSMNKALNSEHISHAQKEIEVQQAWYDAISEELFAGVNPEVLNDIAQRKVAEQQQGL